MKVPFLENGWTSDETDILRKSGDFDRKCKIEITINGE